MWVPTGVAPGVGTGAMLWVLRWAEGGVQPLGGLGSLCQAGMDVSSRNRGWGHHVKVHGNGNRNAVGRPIPHGNPLHHCPSHRHRMAQQHSLGTRQLRENRTLLY